MQEANYLISQAKNIYIIPAENSNEAIPCALALFYTLKQLDKNVNIIIENFPEQFKFLIPSTEFISFPRNFVISVPSSVAEISQVYYEKSDENVKIHLTIDKGNLKKDNISFYYTDAKPDLIITLGIKDYRQELENKLNQYAFLLESDIVNIDNDVQYNRKFGKINLVENSSLSEIIFNLTKTLIAQDSVSAENAGCLLASLINYSDNFTNNNANPNLLKTAADLIKMKADREKIISELYKTPEQKQELFSKMFK